MTTTIYTDEETNSLLKKKRENDGSFNLSAFIKKCLLEDAGNELDEPTIIKNLNDNKIKMQQIQNDIDYWKAQHNSFLREIEYKANEERRELDKLKEGEEIREILRNEKNLEEYKAGVKQGLWSSSVDYAREKIKKDKELIN